MPPTLFDPTMVTTAEEAVDFIGNILESSTEYSIIGKDLDGRILLWNEGARRLYGYEPEEVVLYNLLYNLLSNGIKFTDDGGSVEISVDALDANRFRLAVKDSGIGIRQEDIKRLFREFEQLESGASRRYEGTGLGLALTRKIVELQGGVIDVESEPGKGRTFMVELPIRHEQITQEADHS
ncbi:MAG TPA: ATP-binding protein [Thermoanaerobaculia bacterium]|jgi:signal transduction histidine kinase|nr:ATP-binding protein [Thermoanaerobaculia bacterium]